MTSRRSIRRALVLLLVAVGIGGGRLHAVGREFIPLDSWAYDAIERFEALGVVTLPADRPLTRGEFVDIVTLINDNAFDRRLSVRDRFNLAKLQKEFTEFASRRDPAVRYDPPLVTSSDSPLLLEFDLDATTSVENAFLEDETDVFLKSDPGIKLHWGDRISYEVRYRMVFGPERGARSRNEKPSRRERSFKGLTSLFERSYVIAGWDKAHFFFGREHIDWGTTSQGSLIVPGERHSLDQFGARIKVRNLRLSFFHAQLSPISRRYVAGHRLEMRFGRTVIGINETAIYAGKDVDPVYMFPLSSFYANQFNERDDDNVIWSLDVKTQLRDAVTLFASGLIDDAQFERDGENPDKLAFDVGARWALVWPVAGQLSAHYRFVDIFTYSHRDSILSYVSGEGALGDGDVFLGGAPGPDTDNWRVDAEFYPHYTVVAGVSVFGDRRGVGNDGRSHVRGENIDPSFPLGTVQRTLGFTVHGRLELRRNSTLTALYSHASIDNAGNVSGADTDTDAFRVAFTWDF